MYFKKFDRDKRKFIKNSLMTILFSNIFAFKICAKEKSSYLLSGPLSGKIYYTKNNPGRWKDVLESHLPEASINNNILEVSTLHEMRGYEHYISKHIVLDHKLNIISEKMFDPSKDTPVSKHNIAGYHDKVFILSVCNKHDTWLNLFYL